MTKIIRYERSLVIGTNDTFIESEDCPTKIVLYEDSKKYINFKVLTAESLQYFYITTDMAKDLSKAIEEMSK